MSQAGLTCQELVELVTDYLEGAMSEEERARFEEHLSACSGCQHYLDQMRRTIQMLGRLREEDLSPQMGNDLLAVFRAWKQSARDG